LLKGLAKNKIIKYLNKMVKPLELTPEWVLTELPQSLYADGCGNISVNTSAPNDAKWIRLALNTLHINFQEHEFGDGENTFIDIEFQISDIKEDCPTLYKKMKAVDTKNKLCKTVIIN
jgi:hypothetical protein